MSRLWNDLVNTIEPYVPGEQPKDKKYIKLNTNESPYPPSPKVVEAIDMVSKEDLRLYPDPSCDILRSEISRFYKVNKNQIFLGNGSDEILALAFLTFFNKGETILFPDITYSFYKVYSALFQIDYDLIPLNDDFSIPVNKFVSREKCILIPNPNAPTGIALPVESVEKIVASNRDNVVIIDEAYVDFGAESALSIVDKYDNLLVVKTFSKSRSLAGLRIGYAFGHIDLIDGLERVKNSFNSYVLDRISLFAGKAAVADENYFKECLSKIIATRARVTKELSDLGFNVLPSKANFIFISHKDKPAEIIFENLRKKGVLVRYFKKNRIDNFLRVTIGTEKEMDVLLQKIKEILVA